MSNTKSWLSSFFRLFLSSFFRLFSFSENNYANNYIVIEMQTILIDIQFYEEIISLQNESYSSYVMVNASLLV